MSSVLDLPMVGDLMSARRIGPPNGEVLPVYIKNINFSKTINTSLTIQILRMGLSKFIKREL